MLRCTSRVVAGAIPDARGSQTLFDPETALAEQAAHFLGLTLDPAHLPGVAANLALLQQHAACIAGVSLSPDLDPAPVFVP